MACGDIHRNVGVSIISSNEETNGKCNGQYGNLIYRDHIQEYRDLDN